MRIRVLPTILNAVPIAVRSDKRRDPVAVVPRVRARCFLRFVLSVGKAPKFLLNHVREGLFIVAIVIPE